MRDAWLELPNLFEPEGDQLQMLVAGLKRCGIAYDFDTVTTRVSDAGGSHQIAIWVHRDQAQDAARLIAALFYPPDDSGELATTCEACGAALGNATRCPSCGLNLEKGSSGQDPLFAWVEEHRKPDV